MKGFSRCNRQEKPLGPSLCNELLLIMALALSTFPPAGTGEGTARAGAMLLRKGEAGCCGDLLGMLGQNMIPPFSHEETHKATLSCGAAARGNC